MNSKKVELAPSENKIYQNLLRTTREFVSGKNFKFLSFHQLAEKLAIAPKNIHLFEMTLQALADEGALLFEDQVFKRKFSQPAASRGAIHVHPRGFGFVTLDAPNPYGEDVFIPKHLILNAIDGDVVEIEVNPIVSEKGPEGRVLRIIKRGRTHLAGTICLVEKKGIALAYAPLLGAQQRVIIPFSPKSNLRVGDRVIMEVEEWGNKNRDTVCHVKEVMGHITDPSKDVPAAIEEFNIRSSFPESVIEEAQSFGNRVPVSSLKGREDLRDLEIFTIDPDTAKDFDDALSLTIDKEGCYHLGVHIADVSHYVTLGSELDKEAKERCNSTYFPGVCIPMLPHELSSNLCSLKPNVNRLTASVFIDFDPEGNMLSYRMCRSVIKSAKRFTYREAKEVLDGKKASPHAKTLKRMAELCLLLKKKRFERGSVEFAMPELVVLVDEKGVPTGTDYVEYDITHQLVEEFMLKANELVATHLSDQGKALTYRVHDEPSEENMKDFSLMAAAFGYHLSEVPTLEELQGLFDEAMKTENGRHLANAYIRRMRLAVYSSDNIGHYGLGLSHYCHFTSPIRRYVDLVVHRILFGAQEEKAQLEQIAMECSEKERISAKAEGSVLTLKKLRLLESLRKETPFKQFDAIVTKIKPFGFTFELVDYLFEGFLHVSDLYQDYYDYDDKRMCLIGERHGCHIHLGSKLTVMLREVDFITMECRWALVSLEDGDHDDVTTQPGKKSKSKASPKPKRAPTKAKHQPKMSKQKVLSKGRNTKQNKPGKKRK